MTMNEMKKANLDSVLFDFRLEADSAPNPAILDAYCRKYPKYARELTDYAMQWLIETAIDATTGNADVEKPASSILVSRAISRFHDRVSGKLISTEVAQESSHDVRSPFEELSVVRKREICNILGINIPLLAKFQNRLIDPDTTPRRFLDKFAEILGSTLIELVIYLRLPSGMHRQADFKAEKKPSIEIRKEIFEEAVRNSSLSDQQKQALLKY